MLIVSRRVRYRTVGRGIVLCERCGGDRPYRRRSGRRWLCLLGVPVVPAEPTGEHLRCAVCRTCYRVELLAVPTIARMRAALADGTRAAAVAVLQSGGPASPDARRRAVELITAAGLPGYGEQELADDLAGAAVPELGQLLADLAVQLDPHAREWFLARLARLGLAAGPLTGGQIAVIGQIARNLGMSRGRVPDIIAQAERAARAG
jgi:hypothetical protein